MPDQENSALQNAIEDLLNTAREPLILLDSALRVQRATPAFYRTFLVSREETLGCSLPDLGNGQWKHPHLLQMLEAALHHNQPFQDVEVEYEFPHIGRRAMRLNGRRLLEGQPGTLLLSIEDVTDRREIAETGFRRLFETTREGILVMDVEAEVISDVNDSFLESVGLDRHHVIGKRLAELESFRALPQTPDLIQQLRVHGSVRCDDLEVRRQDGIPLTMELVANLYRLGSQAIVQFNFRDITARKEHEEVLRRSLEEKASLVREIHHRVKNNLQVIVSLMSLQAGYTKDPTAISAFEEMEGRVRAIAQIHETLYATPDLAQIEFAAYLTKLVRELVALHSRSSDAIRLDFDVQEMVLHMEQAIPLGLIANEIVLNSLKHGMIDGRGSLSVALTYLPDPDGDSNSNSLDEGCAQLEVCDHGAGLPAGFDWTQSNSMGFRLLKLLVKQLRGRVEFQSGSGLKVRIQFPLALQ